LLPLHVGCVRLPCRPMGGAGGSGEVPEAGGRRGSLVIGTCVPTLVPLVLVLCACAAVTVGYGDVEMTASKTKYNTLGTLAMNN
jgi:hypothetical protein